MVNLYNSLVRNLTNITDTDILSDEDLNEIVGKAEDKVENDAQLVNSPDTIQEEAAMYWACRLVAMKMRGASAVKEDDNLKLEDPDHYRQEYMETRDREEDGPPSANIMTRVGAS